MRNYAGHRLAPWLAHVMVSRQETARPLLTQGEVMQLPASDELVMIAGLEPIRAKKLRYFTDRNFLARALPAPVLVHGRYRDVPPTSIDPWGRQVRSRDARLTGPTQAEGGLPEDGMQQQRHPAIEDQPIDRTPPKQLDLLGLDRDDSDPATDKSVMDQARQQTDVVRARAMNEGDGHTPGVGPDSLPSF